MSAENPTRSAAVIAEAQADREERQQLRQYRQDLQVILDGWDAASNAQKFVWLKEVTRTLRRALKLI